MDILRRCGHDECREVSGRKGYDIDSRSGDTSACEKENDPGWRFMPHFAVLTALTYFVSIHKPKGL